jgi:hypothetical protein
MKTTLTQIAFVFAIANLALFAAFASQGFNPYAFWQGFAWSVIFLIRICRGK